VDSLCFKLTLPSSVCRLTPCWLYQIDQVGNDHEAAQQPMKNQE
jgi:hypothetical protein